MTGWQYVHNPGFATVEELKSAIYAYGPIVVNVCASNWYSYTGGIFSSSCYSMNHMVILVGWDDPGRYWIVRNSWGQSWGLDGYMLIRWGTSNIGLTGASWVTTASAGGPPVIITKAGAGRGTVTSSPAGINCGSTCSARFIQGDHVTLTPTPEGSGAFLGWSGEKCFGKGPCTVTMNYGSLVTAYFDSHPHVQLPQTGQVACYDGTGTEIPCAGTGQDGEIKAGIPWLDPRFVVSGDCVTDNLTGLVWARNGNPPNGAKTWDNAIDYPKNLALCGYSDWRLPNVNELESLLNPGVSSNASWLNSQGFINVAAGFYWSSTFAANIDGYSLAWGVRMDNSGISGEFRETANNVLPVRGTSSVVWQTGQTTSYHPGDDGELRQGLAWPSLRFTDNGDDTATDNLTGLVWTKNASTQAMTWQDALNYVKYRNTENYLGHSDWRLPNRKELRSLIDYSSSVRQPLVQPGHPFTGIQGWYWSSTTVFRGQYNGDAWAVDMFWGGSMSDIDKHSYTSVHAWLVRDGLYRILSVAKTGTGSGAVTSKPSGINCGAVCSAIFPQGTSVTLTPVPAAGSFFGGWSGGNCSGTGTCTVTMGKAVNVTAIFSRPQHILAVSKSGAGTVTSVPSGISCGATCSASFSQGTTVTLTAIPATPSTFTGWSGGGCSGTGTCKVTMNSEVSVAATFALKQFAVTASAPGGHGKASPASQNINYWSDASITITPDTGYHIASILDNGVSKPTSSSYGITNVTAPHAVEVTFASANQCTVNVSVSGGHGTASPVTQTGNRGGNASIAITPDAGYKIESITDNGKSVPIANPYMINNITADHAVVVTFTIIRFTVRASISDGLGAVNPATQKVNIGGNASIAITPDAGYKIESITDNGKSMPIANPYLINNITADHTVIVAVSLPRVVALPKTGQMKCYDTIGTEVACSGTGQDGETQAGAPWPVPRFIRGTGVAADCMTDNLTGAMWPRNMSLSGTKSWENAIDYANSLTLCGYSDWRLPNINELESLVNSDVQKNSDWLASQGFTGLDVDYRYWSSTSDANAEYYNRSAWYVYMWGGSVDRQIKGDGGYAWPVRAGGGGSFTSALWQTGQGKKYRTGDDGDLRIGAAWPSPRFADNGNDTVTDTLSGLMWTKDADAPGPAICEPATTKTLHDALDYVACLNAQKYLGYSDWRLPNRKELFSLIDYSQYRPSLPGYHPFQNVKTELYWSSTAYASSNRNWLVNMYNGEITAVYKSSSDYYVWPVRAGQLSGNAVLSVSKHGIGSGTVSSSPIGVDCGSICSNSFARGTSVVLTATPVAPSTFAGWSGGGCGTADSCTVTMGSDVTITAVFTIQHVVGASVSGGHGTVSPASQRVTRAGNASITITPDTGYHIASITDNGVSKPISNPYRITNVTAPHAVVVTFSSRYALVVSKSGIGTVISSPAGINCGTTCSAPFADGTTVTLTAIPATPSTFTGWSGGGCSGTGTCKVTMNSEVSVAATFALKQFAVTASAPGGHGKASPASQNINYWSDASIAITPDTGYHIASITDNGVSKPISNPYRITNVIAPHTVVVTFSSQYTLAVSKSGAGTVTSVPSGISCGATCSASFSQGTTVTLTAIPATPSTFTGWSGGGCSGTGTCKVTMNSEVSVAATFALKQFAVTASAPGGHGKVSPASQNINYWSDASITITPDQGYHVATITDNGVSVPVTTLYVIRNVTAAHNVAVTFSQ